MIFKHEIGEIVNDVKIIDRYIRTGSTGKKDKYYKYICLKDESHVGDKSEGNFNKGTGCVYCTGQVVITGVNDIATTNARLFDLLANKEDAYKYTQRSNRKANFKCPNCNHIKEMTINDVYRQGMACNKCGDGISFGEKVVFNLLEQLNIDFIPQLSSKTFDWCNKYKYDFYISDLDMIIECHGSQHYDESLSRRKNKNEKAIDDIKYELAKNNVSHYITIDCRYSDIEWIKASILNELLSIFDFSNIDWSNCLLFATSSRIIEVCDLFKGGIIDLKEIASITRLDYTTVNKYLNKGNVIGICNYNAKESHAKGVKQKLGKRVKVIETNKIYSSITDLAEKSIDDLGVKLRANAISSVCCGNHKSHKGYHFEHVE